MRRLIESGDLELPRLAVLIRELNASPLKRPYLSAFHRPQGAGHLFEMAARAAAGAGQAMAREALDSGRAWAKFQAICEAQGGLREPPEAPFRRDFPAARAGRVTRIDNRRIAMAAKLSGAPSSPAAGLRMAVQLGDRVEPGQCLFTLHAQTRGELDYAAAYIDSQNDLLVFEEHA